MVSSYAFAMFSAHLRNAVTLAAPKSILGKRRRSEEEDEEDKENQEDIEPPCKRQCVRPDFDFEADNPFWVDDDDEDIRHWHKAEVEVCQSSTLRWVKLQQEEYHWEFGTRIERWRKAVSPW